MKNIGYYSGNYTIKNVYIGKKNCNLSSKKKLKIRIIPYSKKYSTGFISIKDNGRHFLDPFYDETNNNHSNIFRKYTDDNIADERIKRTIKKVLADDYDFVLFPETLKPELAEFVFNECKTHKSIVIGPAFYENLENNQKQSKIYVTSSLFLGGRIIVKKTKSYKGKYVSNDISYEENIIANKEYTILHIEGLGRILFLICSDVFYVNQEYGRNLIYSMNIDFIFVVSCTESYTEFDKYYFNFRKENRVFIQSNLCSECLKKDLNKDLVPCNHNFEKEWKFNVRNCNCEKVKNCHIEFVLERKENIGFDLISVEQK